MTASQKIAFILAATQHGPLILNRLDAIYPRPDYVYGVGGETLEFGSYERDDAQSLKQLLQIRRSLHGDGVVALDVGANIGIHTIEMARESTGWGRVIAIEAQERIYYALAGNIALNNCFNATALHAAAAAEPGSIRVPMLDYQSTGSFGSLSLTRDNDGADVKQAYSYDEDRSQEVRALSIDSLDLPRLDLIKIDVEGMELDVLKGAADTLARLRPFVFAEHIKVGVEALEQVLKPLNYRMVGHGLNIIASPMEGPELTVARS